MKSRLSSMTRMRGFSLASSKACERKSTSTVLLMMFRFLNVFLLGQHSSIHHQGSAGGKFRVVGTEIENRRGDFFAGANAPDRMKRREVIAHLAFFSGKTIDHVGCNTGGGHCVNTDILFGELQRESFGQAFDRMLGRGVDADLTHANVPGHARGIDDCSTPAF